MTTFIIIAGIYLLIGAAIVIFCVVTEPMLMAIPWVLILMVLLWPYFLVRMWVDR